MRASTIDRHIRAFQRYNAERRDDTAQRPPRHEIPLEAKVWATSLHDLAAALRDKQARRCAPFVRPMPPSSFRLIPDSLR